jgi:hypothetical protein
MDSWIYGFRVKIVEFGAATENSIAVGWVTRSGGEIRWGRDGC